VFGFPGKTVLASRRTRAQRATLLTALAASATLAVAVGLVAASGGGSGTAGAAGVPGKSARTVQAAGPGQPAGRGVTLLATVSGTAPRYASPGRRSAGTVPADWYGRPSVLPVIATRSGWVKVRLAQRPDGSTAWLPAGDVRLSSTPFRIVISLGETRLTLYEHGRPVFSAPAGVGASDDPTPTGQYFLAFDEQPPQPNPGYGPFIMVTSAHSRTISDYQGSGDAIIGIHGPLGMDGAIGVSGARISHGCVRLHEQALERLSQVPPGTPIDVVG
jgi:lipoprotein-anchoring transpeptidase ErfK/SrfK